MPAMVASVGCTASHAIVFALSLTLRAVGYAVRPALLLNILKAGIISGEFLIEVPHGVAKCFGYALFGFHTESVPCGLLVVKGYLPVRPAFAPVKNRYRRSCSLEPCRDSSRSSQSSCNPAGGDRIIFSIFRRFNDDCGFRGKAVTIAKSSRSAFRNEAGHDSGMKPGSDPDFKPVTLGRLSER